MNEDGPARPEPLAPADRALIDLIRRGCPDAEIAVRLGLPIGEEKARVALLLERLQLGSRAAVKEWDGVLPTAVPRARPWPEAQSAPVAEDAAPAGSIVLGEGAAAATRGARGLAFLPLAVLLALLAGVGGWVVFSSGGGSGATPRPDGGATIDAFIAASLSVDGVSVPPLKIGAPIALPDDLGLIQWETQNGVIRRIYRDRDRVQRVETLFGPIPGGAITQVAASTDGREIVVTLATPKGNTTPPFTTFYRSRDGGANWNLVGFSGEGSFVTAAGPDVLVVALDGGDSARRRELLPGRVPLPTHALVAGSGANWPVVGTTIHQGATTALTRFTSGVALRESGRFAVRFRTSGNSSATGVGLTDADGALMAGFSGPVRAVVGAISGTVVAVDYDTEPVINGMTLPGVVAPALVDTVTGVLRPIDTGFALDEDVYTLAVQRGPLVRIDGSAGCVPVRDHAAIDGGVLYCATNGTLVRAMELRIHNDYTWLGVANGDAPYGWVDVGYVLP